MSVEDPSITELREMLVADTALVDPAVPPAVAAPAAAPVGAAEPAPAQEPAAVVQERDEHGKFVTKEPAAVVEEVIPPGAQKAIDKEIGKAVRARRETERLNARLEKQLRRLEEATPPAPNTPPKPAPAAAGKPKPVLAIPKIEDFEYDTERHEAARSEATAQYTEALTDWKIEQRELAREATARAESQQTAVQSRAQKIQARIEEGRAEFADFDDVVMAQDAPITETMLDAIVASPPGVGTKLAYHLGSHRDELTRLAKLPAAQQAFELGTLAATLKTAPKAAALPAKASPGSKEPLPKPPIVVGAEGVPAGVDLDTADMRAFRREVDRLLHPGR